MPDLYGQRGRFLVGVALLVALIGLMCWAGATAAEPLDSAYPDEVEVTPNSEAYVGEQVVLGGYVVDTEPVVIATRASGYGRFTVENADDNLQRTNGPLEEGDDVTTFGTLTDESTLDAERALTREPFEAGYMYIVSLIGGLWVTGRFVRGWRFDRDTLAFVPRECPLTIRNMRSGDTRKSRSTNEHRPDQTRESDDQSPLKQRDHTVRTNSDGGEQRG